MKHVTSADGTTIAFDQVGSGDALILVGGSFEQRAMPSETSQLAASSLLADHFTIFHYDRRGRGDSGDTQPYAVAREIEDIEALINEAGGKAYLSGISSGAALVLEAALALGDKVQKLALYEPPYNDDADAREAWKNYRQQVGERLAAGQNGEAVDTFMGLLGVPPEQLAEMRHYPMWGMWEAVAPTLAYEGEVMGEDASLPTERAATLPIPTLVMNGEESYPFMHTAATALAAVIPNATHRVLGGQNHVVTPEALAPVLIEFFTA